MCLSKEVKVSGDSSNYGHLLFQSDSFTHTTCFPFLCLGFSPQKLGNSGMVNIRKSEQLEMSSTIWICSFQRY